jgi:hypothetical protein
MFRLNDQHRQMEMLSTLTLLPEGQLKRLEESWAGVFYREFFARLDERPFAVLYSTKDSRPNIPVNVLVALEALKAGFNWSDEEMYDAFCFDLQVRYALGYRTLGEGQFDLRTVYNFRHRLSEHMQKTGVHLIEKSFEQVTDRQMAAFALRTGLLRMDSTQIASNICNLSRLQLLVEILQRIHRMLSEVDRARYAEPFAPYLRGTSGQYVYHVKSADGPAHMTEIGRLMHRLVRELAATYGDQPTYALLQRVFSEHYVVEEERVRLKVGKELRADSLNSPDDPEATYRDKNGRSYKGYVTNVTETCDPGNPFQLVAKVQTAPNVTNDDDLLIAAVPSVTERLAVEEIHTDGGYNSEESAQVLDENGIEHVQTAIRGHAPTVHLGLDTFEITMVGGEIPVEVTCPHGQTVPVEASKAPNRYLAHFDATTCATCPFVALCPTRAMTSKPLRTLQFTRHDAEIARRRRRMAADRADGRNLRVPIESTIASVKRPFGFGQLPVRGLFRVHSLLVGVATLINVRRIHRYLVRRDEEAQAMAAVASSQECGIACAGTILHHLQRFIRLLSVHTRQAYAF